MTSSQGGKKNHMFQIPSARNLVDFIYSIVLGDLHHDPTLQNLVYLLFFVGDPPYCSRKYWRIHSLIPVDLNVFNFYRWWIHLCHFLGEGIIFQSSKCFSETLTSNKIGAFERNYIEHLNLFAECFTHLHQRYLIQRSLSPWDATVTSPGRSVGQVTSCHKPGEFWCNKTRWRGCSSGERNLDRVIWLYFEESVWHIQIDQIKCLFYFLRAQKIEIS